MILPTKHLRNESCLIYIGGVIRKSIGSKYLSVDEIWRSTKKEYDNHSYGYELTFDWFVLALSLLYVIGVIRITDGKIIRDY